MSSVQSSTASPPNLSKVKSPNSSPERRNTLTTRPPASYLQARRATTVTTSGMSGTNFARRTQETITRVQQIAGMIDEEVRTLLHEEFKRIDEASGVREADDKIKNGQITSLKQLTAKLYTSLSKRIKIWSQNFVTKSVTDALELLDAAHGIRDNDIVLMALVFRSMHAAWNQEIQEAEDVKKKSAEINKSFHEKVRAYYYSKGSYVVGAYFLHWLQTERKGEGFACCDALDRFFADKDSTGEDAKKIWDRFFSKKKFTQKNAVLSRSKQNTQPVKNTPVKGIQPGTVHQRVQSFSQVSQTSPSSNRGSISSASNPSVDQVDTRSQYRVLINTTETDNKQKKDAIATASLASRMVKRALSFREPKIETSKKPAAPQPVIQQLAAQQPITQQPEAQQPKPFEDIVNSVWDASYQCKVIEIDGKTKYVPLARIISKEVNIKDPVSIATRAETLLKGWKGVNLKKKAAFSRLLKYPIEELEEQLRLLYSSDFQLTLYFESLLTLMQLTPLSESESSSK